MLNMKTPQATTICAILVGFASILSACNNGKDEQIATPVAPPEPSFVIENNDENFQNETIEIDVNIDQEILPVDLPTITNEDIPIENIDNQSVNPITPIQAPTN